MFIRDLRRLRRGEPIKFWFLDEIQPGDQLYQLAVFQILKPYLVFFGVVALSACLIGYITWVL
jgi:hypothetical protein